jgi:hypothetical protein
MKRRWPTGLSEAGTPRFVRPILAEDFSYLLRSRAGIRLRLRSPRALSAKPDILN